MRVRARAHVCACVCLHVRRSDRPVSRALVCALPVLQYNPRRPLPHQSRAVISPSLPAADALHGSRHWQSGVREAVAAVVPAVVAVAFDVL